MTLGSYLVGLALFGIVLAAAVAAALHVAARWLPRLGGVPRAVAISLLATATLIALHLGPAALGVMTRWSVAALAAIVLAASAIALRRSATPDSERGALAPGGDSPVSTALAAIAVIALAVYSAAILARFGSVPPTFIDTVTFHLPGVARWIQSHSIWQIDQFLPGQAQGYYPNNGNVVELAATLPWHAEFLSRFVNLPFLGLTVLAGYAAGRELGAPRSSAAIAAAAAVSVPAVTSYVVDAPTPDTVMYATFTAGLLFCLRHVRTGERSDLLLAGLGLGIAFGTRWYGVAAVAVVVAVWIGARLAFERRPRIAARDLGLLGGAIAIAGGIWLLRNWVESGNPFFPVRVDPLGVTILDAPDDPVRALVGFTIGGYLGNWQVLSDYVLPALEVQVGYVAPALGVGAAAAAVLAVRASGDPARARVIGLAAATLGLFVVYLITPYTALGLRDLPLELGANVRYLVPAMLAAAPAVAWAIGRARGRTRAALELILVVLALDGLRRGVDVSGTDLVAGAAITASVALVAVAIGLAIARRRPAVLVALVAAAMALAAVGARAVETAYLDDRYTGVTPTLDAALARAPDGTTIGLAGAWPVTTLSPVLALFGPELENRVSYIGETRDGMLLPYTDEATYREALARGGYDLVMVGNEKPLAFPQVDEAGWTRAVGYAEVAVDSDFTLFERSPG